MITFHNLRKSIRVYGRKLVVNQETTWEWHLYELVEMGKVYVCCAGCSSSSRKGLFGKIYVLPKSATMNDETIVQCDKEVDHKSNGNSRYIEDWFAHTCLAKDYFVKWQSSPIIKSKILCILRFRIVSGKDASIPWVHRRMENKVEWFTCTPQYRELDRNDGEPKEFEWTTLPGFTSLQILAEIQKRMNEMWCELEQFSGRIIFMSMYNDIVWWEKGNKEWCIATSRTVAGYATRFAQGHLSFLGPAVEEKWCGSNTYKTNGEWDDVAEHMLLQL